MVGGAGTKTVTLIRTVVGPADEYGNDTHTTEEFTVAGVAIWPKTSSEDNDARTFVIAGYEALFPPGVKVEATDRVQIDEAVWEIDGQPAGWTSALTGLSVGIQASLRRVTG